MDTFIFFHGHIFVDVIGTRFCYGLEVSRSAGRLKNKRKHRQKLRPVHREM